MEQYEVVRPIGSGSFGQVFLVLHKIEQRHFVMKSIELNTSSPEGREATELEVAVLNKMRHPNIVAFWDSFLDSGGYLCILMEYCEHGDIYSFLQDAKKSHKVPEEARLVEWFIQVTLALQALHHKRIMHRDLKTQNIFLTGCKISGNFALKLGDFGIARTLNSTSDLAKTQIGTPFYMSPELINNRPYGIKSDIWGLGCVLYEIVNGQRAFDAHSLNGLALKIIKGNYTPITTSCSQSTKNLIKLMLSKSPKNRPTLKEILHSSAIRTRIPLVQRSVVAAGPPEGRLAVSQALVEQLASLGIGEPDAVPRRDGEKLQQQLRRVEMRKQHEEDVLQHTVALLEECLHTSEAGMESWGVPQLDARSLRGEPPRSGRHGPSHHPSAPSSAAPCPAMQGLGSPRRPGHGSPRGSSGEPHERYGPPISHRDRAHKQHRIYIQEETASPPGGGNHHRAGSKVGVERRERHKGGSSSHSEASWLQPAPRPRPRARTEDVVHYSSGGGGGHAHVAQDGHYSSLVDLPHIRPGNLAHPFESVRPNVVHSPKSTFDRRPRGEPRRRDQSPPAAPPRHAQYGEPQPPKHRPERSGGWRTGEWNHAEKSGGPPRPPIHSVCLESLPGTSNGGSGGGFLEVEQTRLPVAAGHAHRTPPQSLSEESMSSGSLTEVQELDEWEGLSDASSGWGGEASSGAEESQRRPQALRQRIDECQAAIHKHRLTIEMYQYLVAHTEEQVAASEAAGGSGGGLPPFDAVAAAAAAQGGGGARGIAAPTIVQDCAARLMRRCLEGLGSEKFQAARRCLMASLDAAELPTSARGRMLELLGLDKIGFLSMLDQLVHMERRWGSQDMSLH